MPNREDNMTEERMDNETGEEVELITITGEDGQEEYYAEDVTIEYAGKQFAVLVPYVEDEEAAATTSGDAIIARIDEEDGEPVYVSPTDEEFDAVVKIYDQIVAEDTVEE